MLNKFANHVGLKINLIIFFLMCTVAISAQKMILKSVSLRHSDLYASINPRKDVNGKDCAVIKVAVIGVENLEFFDAVGDVEYKLGEYIVYVMPGIKTFDYRISETNFGVVNFDDYGLEIESKRVYSVVLETETPKRAAIFSVEPRTAELIFDGQKEPIDSNGIAIIEKIKGEYQYRVSANGHDSQEGVLKLNEDELYTRILVNLKRRTYPLYITCSIPNAFLYIDNVHYGSLLDEVNDHIRLPEGSHTIRLTSIGYDDYIQQINVDGQPIFLNVALQEGKIETKKYSEKRTRTSVNLPNSIYLRLVVGIYGDNKRYGYEFKPDISFIQRFGTIFALREGLGVGFGTLENEVEFEKDEGYWFFDVPLQFGLSFALNKYRNYIMSALGGGYLRIGDRDYKESNDCGFCSLLQLDCNNFIFGSEFGISKNLVHSIVQM